MKRIILCLLAVLLSTAWLTACGTDKDASGNSGQAGNGSVADGSVDPDGDGNLEGNPPDTAIPGDGSTDGDTSGDALTGGGTAGNAANGGTSAGDAAGTRAGNRAGDGAVVRGATYEQMVRNGFVRDADGNLTDGENTVTPGTVY